MELNIITEAGGRSVRSRAARSRSDRMRRCGPRPRASQAARPIEVDAGIIKFGQTETLRRAARDSSPWDTLAVAGGDAARGGAPVRKIAANRVCAKSSSFSSIRHLRHLGCTVRPEGSSRFCRASRSPHLRPRNKQTLPREAGRQTLNILHIRRPASFSLPTVSNTLPGDLFRATRSRRRRRFLSRAGLGTPVIGRDTTRKGKRPPVRTRAFIATLASENPAGPRRKLALFLPPLANSALSQARLSLYKTEI